jgi:hypothetical protein
MPVLPNQLLTTTATNQNTSVGAQIGQFFGSTVSGQIGLNPLMGRQNVNDMYVYSPTNTTGFKVNGPNSFAVTYPGQAPFDWRVRVSLAPNSNYFYKDPSNVLLSPLRTPGATNNITTAISGGLNSLFGASQGRIGVIFPYTPTVSITNTAKYTAQELTHNNYVQYFYDHSAIEAITIQGEFTVQNVNEGQYLLAAIYFFRSVTKMFFGAEAMAGNPPPIVYLNGYGQYYLPNVPCVVTQFQHTMPDAVDYIEVPEPGLVYNPAVQSATPNSTRLPTTSTVSLTLQPVYSRIAQSQGFSLNDFARGALINASSTDATGFKASRAPLNGGAPGAGGFL